MFFSNSNVQDILTAIEKSQAVIEFTPEGKILRANDNFLMAMGYKENEIIGKHHSMFVAPSYAQSQDYKTFWENLNKGEILSEEFQRFGKENKEVWIQGSYNPIINAKGKVYKVVKFATDITVQKLLNAEMAGQVQAIGKVQAIIEFELDGTIITANDIFLDALGYRLEDIVGKKHSMFIEPEFAKSKKYLDFWNDLRAGKPQSDEYKRLGKNNKEVWIQGNYNPIFDMNGKIFKVVKFARDITERKLKNADFEGQIDAIGKSQAVIEFELDGTIIHANDNFLNALGYRLDEIVGQKHSMFVDETYRNSPEYTEFWNTLNRGEYVSNEFKRLGKGGKEVWIQASYNPILDMNGHPFKVVNMQPISQSR